MRRRDTAVYAVDLFADVLVHADGVTYRVCDLEEVRQGTAGDLSCLVRHEKPSEAWPSSPASSSAAS